MVSIRKCTFCGKNIEPGVGKMVVDAAGSVSFYCSSKCQKNAELGRSPRKIRWTGQYRKEKLIRVQHLRGAESKKGSKKESDPEKKGQK